MTSFKKYFTYHFKNTFWRLAIIAFLCSLPVWTSIYSSYQPYNSPFIYLTEYIDLTLLSTLSIIVSTIVPLLELLPFKNRRNMDTMLFLPIDRRKMAATHFINGFIQIFLVNLVTFISAAIVMLSHSFEFNVWNLFLLFAFTILGSLIVYSLIFFIFDRANTTADGLIWILIYTVIGRVLYSAVIVCYEQVIGKEIKPEISELIRSECFNPYNVIDSVWYTLYRLLFPCVEYQYIGTSKTPVYHTQTVIDKYEITAIILWSCISVLCIFGFLWHFKRKRPEDIGSISSSAFGYKVLIPLFAASVLFGFGYLENITIVIIAMVICYVIYRRSIKFKLADYISMAAVISPAILMIIVNIISKTKM